MISYKALEKRLKEKGLKKSDLTKEPGISSRTIAKLAKGEKISRLTLQKIADFLACEPADLFLIEDSKKSFYYKGLANWNREKGWLTDTCLDGQDTFKRMLELFEIDCKHDTRLGEKQ